MPSSKNVSKRGNAFDQLLLQKQQTYKNNKDSDMRKSIRILDKMKDFLGTLGTPQYEHLFGP